MTSKGPDTFQPVTLCFLPTFLPAGPLLPKIPLFKVRFLFPTRSLSSQLSSRQIYPSLQMSAIYFHNLPSHKPTYPRHPRSTYRVLAVMANLQKLPNQKLQNLQTNLKIQHRYQQHFSFPFILPQSHNCQHLYRSMSPDLCYLGKVALTIN